MKRLLCIPTLLFLALTAYGQEGYGGNKLTDNCYVGLSLGYSSRTTHTRVLHTANPNIGVRLGKWYTPELGIAFDANLILAETAENFSVENENLYTFSPTLYIQGNLGNIFCGYHGTARKIEYILNIGLGYMHSNSLNNHEANIGSIRNAITQSIALDITWNFGRDREWQVFLEPMLTYLIAGAKGGESFDGTPRQTCGFDLNYSYLHLNVGIAYKFRNSTNRHNFTILTPCTNKEEESLNAEINALRGKLAETGDLQAEIEMLRQKIRDMEAECGKTLAPVVEKENPGLPAVFYKVNSSVVTPAQQQNVAIAAEILKNHPKMKLMIKGYASPEGNAQGNNVLSEKRAEAVRNMLINTYGISASRIVSEGCGATDKLFPIYEFNRVAMLYLVTE